jgi:hypothetical protein
LEFHARNAENLGLQKVLDVILTATWKYPHGDGYAAQIANVVDDAVLYDLMGLAANGRASDEVRAITGLELHNFHDWLNAPTGGRQSISDQAHIAFALRQIEQFEKDPKKIDLTAPAEAPDGPPIGADDDWDFED